MKTFLSNLKSLRSPVNIFIILINKEPCVKAVYWWCLYLQLEYSARKYRGTRASCKAEEQMSRNVGADRCSCLKCNNFKTFIKSCKSQSWQPQPVTVNTAEALGASDWLTRVCICSSNRSCFSALPVPSSFLFWNDFLQCVTVRNSLSDLIPRGVLLLEKFVHNQ